MPATPAAAAAPRPLFRDKGKAFMAIPKMVAACRALVRSGSFAHGLADLRDDICIVTTELATNAVSAMQIEHQAGRPGALPPIMAITVDWLTFGVRVGIWDDSPGTPVVRSPDWDAESGRGLLIVNQLTAGRWGWFPADSGKCVWAEVVRAPRR
jgi:hypothetical protein